MTTPHKEFDRTVNDILSRIEYTQLRYSIRNFIENIKQAITDWLYEKLSNANWDISPEFSGNLSTILIIAASIVVIGIIVLVIVSISRGLEKNKKIREILGEKIDGDSTPESFRKKSGELAEKGEYRRAIRYDFIALLFLMHNSNILYLDKARTNKEIYLQLKDTNFSELEGFNKLIRVFNQVWYGHKECQQEAYNGWKKTYKQLWSEVNNYEKK
ncbi:MAG: hypothetical protein ACLFPF_09000 [Halanaerobiales bacterium]